MPPLKIQRLFRVLPWLLVVFLGLLFIGLLTHELHRQELVWQQQLAVGAESQRKLVAAAQQNAIKEARLVVHLIAQDQTVIELFRSAHHLHQQPSLDTQRLNFLRQQLAAYTAAYWDEIRQADGRQLTFYFAPDATAFFRAHSPEKYQDLSQNIRPLVMEAMASGETQAALEVGRHGSGYRAVLPIFATDADGTGTADTVIGALEVGFGLLSMQSSLDDGGAAVLLHSEAMKNLLWKQADTAMPAGTHSSPDQWMLEKYYGEEVAQWAAAGVLPDPLARENYQLLSWDNRHYSVYVTPLYDFLGERDPARPAQVAILGWRDITDAFHAHARLQRDTRNKWLLALLITEAVLILLLRLSSRYVQFLLKEHQTHLEQERDASEEARQQLALALDSSESGFWEWYFLEGRAKFSSHWRKICGIGDNAQTLPDVEEWLARVHPQDRDQCVQQLQRHQRGEISLYEDEYRIRNDDGSYRWLYARGKIVEWRSDGKAARAVGVFTDITARKHAELTVLRQQAALRALNEIASLPTLEPQEQLRRALVLGASYLALPVGIISQVKDEQYRVRVQVAPSGMLRDGDTFSLDDTYCSLTLGGGEVLAIDAMGESPYRGHPCYQIFRLESYIGVPLWVGGSVCGTLNFSGASQRFFPFDELDKDFMRLMGRWVSATLDRWQQLTNQQDLLQGFRKLGERLPGFLFQFQRRADGSAFFPYASVGIEDICGVRPEQAVVNADAVFAVVHPEDSAWIKDSIIESAQHLTAWSPTFRINHATRGLLWVRGNSMPEKLSDGSVLWHGFLSDITEEKMADMQRQATQALQQAILDAASLAIIAVDKRGIIQVFNRGAEHMLGYTAAEVVDRHSPALFHLSQEVEVRAQELSKNLGAEVQPDVDVFLAKLERSGSEEREWTYLRKDGTPVPVLLTTSTMRNHQGEVTGFLGIAKDITESKRIERMKNAFIATVSHELRTPLTALSGSLSLISSGAAGKVPEAMEKMLSIAQKNSERLIFLVNDLLDMERLAAGKMQFHMNRQPLQPIIEEALETNSPYAAQHRVSFRLHGELSDIWVYVDAQRLVQVLTNLLSNAAKFSPAGSSVVINVDSNDADVRVTVIDEGIGIPDNFRAHIFQKFAQADSSDARNKGGTGLGLAICKELIEKMGGSIGFDSAPGEGSRFYFILPRVPSEAIQ